MSPTEGRDQRKMIRRDLREARADKLGFLDVQGPLEINVIQMQQREESGIAAPLPNVQRQVETFELVGQQTCSQSLDPFIEITYQYARTDQVLVDLPGRQQTSDLMPPLEVAGSHVDVENMKSAPRRFQVGADTASAFPICP